MVRVGKHVKHAKDTKTKVSEDVSLEEIIKLGGDKDDLKLLKNIEDGGAAVDEEDDDAAGIAASELQDFIAGLGFDNITEKEVLPVEEEDLSIFDIKLAQRPLTEEEKEEVTEKAQVASEKKKDKKSKNKFKNVQDDEVSSTSKEVKKKNEKAEPAEDYEYVSSTQSSLLFKPGDKWYNNQFVNDPADFPAPSSGAMKKLLSLTDQIVEDEIARYKKVQEKHSKAPGSEGAWLRTVLTSGTLTDKMAALTLLVQEAPLHNLNALESLVAMSEKKGRREAVMAVDTLKELFLEELLPEDRKLLTFEQHPLTKLGQLTSGNRDSRNKRLLLWQYENKLKEVYSRYLEALEKLAQDTVAASKKKALGIIFTLLAGRPEQEKRLLAILVNKLGDPDYKIASKSGYLLGRLVDQHPNMKLVVCLEVERLLFRPNVQTKAQYYGVCFLHGVTLGHEDRELAARLLNTYFTFFQMFVKRGEVDSKMLRALLTGVNRVYPYAKMERERVAAQVDTLYRVVHIVNFNTGLQALTLLHQVMDLEDSTADRFYMALYRKLIDPALKDSAHQPLFLNLLFKAIQKDAVNRRVKAFVKRLLQVCCYMPPTFICGALVLLSEVGKSRRDVIALTRVAVEEDDDEEEHFVDAAEESDEEKMEETVNKALQHKGHTTTTPSWLHRKHALGVGDNTDYDAHQRNPLHSHADTECCWELSQLASHYHPSVALFAKTLLQKQVISYPGNPLQDFTLIRFLDRFVYRNPKKVKPGQDDGDKRGSAKRDYVPAGLRGMPVNSEEYLLSDADKIPADENFFYQYFTHHSSQKAAKQGEDVDSDAGSISDDEFDDFLDSYERGFEDKDYLLDFAGEASKSKSKKGKKAGSDEDEDDDDDDLELSDEEVDLGGEDDDLRKQFAAEMEDMGTGWEDTGDLDEEDLDLDEEAVDFSDEGDDDDDMEPMATKKLKKRKMDTASSDEEDLPMTPAEIKRMKREKQEDLTHLFASADDFAHLLEDTGGSSHDMGTSGAMAVKSARDAKQLEWETKRNDWGGGGGKKQRRGGKSASTHNRPKQNRARRK